MYCGILKVIINTTIVIIINYDDFNASVERAIDNGIVLIILVDEVNDWLHFRCLLVFILVVHFYTFVC